MDLYVGKKKYYINTQMVITRYKWHNPEWFTQWICSWEKNGKYKREKKINQLNNYWRPTHHKHSLWGGEFIQIIEPFYYHHTKEKRNGTTITAAAAADEHTNSKKKVMITIRRKKRTCDSHNEIKIVLAWMRNAENCSFQFVALILRNKQ